MLSLILSLVAPVGLFLIPQKAMAATTISVDNGGSNAYFPGAPIKASSSAVGVVKISLTALQASQTLNAVTVNFSGTGFTVTDLLDLATGNTSGVALYNDAGTTAGSFDASDAVITLQADPAWSGANFTLIPATPVSLTSGAAVIVYVVIKTSANIASQDIIAATIPANGVVTSDGNGPAANFTVNAYRADTTAPTITEVRGYAGAGNRTLTVRFSEPVQKVGTGNIAFVSSTDPLTYTDNGTDGGTVVTAISHNTGQDFMTVTIDEDLDSGDFDDTPSTLAAASNKIMDMAGNVMGTGAVNLSSPLNITTAVVPSTYVGAAYPSTSTLVTFAASGGTAAYSFTANGASTTTLSNLGLSLATNGKLTSTAVANRTGSYTVDIKVTDSTPGTPLTATRLFTINVAATSGGGIPGLSSVSPAGLAQSATSTLTITGVNTHFASGSSTAAFSLPVGQAGTNGITVNSVTVNSATSISVAVTVAANATAASRDLTVTTGAEVVSMPNAFGVFAGGASGLTLLFPADGGTNVQLPPPFTFNPSTNANLNSYRITVKSTADFSGAALWDYVFPKPADAQNTNNSHCNSNTCSFTYGEGRFRIMTQPTALAPNTTYYWQVRTYSQTTGNVSDNTMPLEFTQARGFTTVTSVTDTTPPSIMHRPIFRTTESANLDVIARVMDNMATLNTSPALTTKIFYCGGAGCSATTEGATPTHLGDGYFSYRIPAATVGAANDDPVVRYYLRASDGTNTYEFKEGVNPFTVTVVAAGGSTITGTVMDSSGTCSADVRQATVFVEGTGFSTTSSNDANCTYTLSNLPAGTYDLRAFKLGWSERMIAGIPAGSSNIGFRLSQGMGGGFAGDTTRPRVRFNGPMDGMTGIPGGDTNSRVFVVFDKSMSQNTITASNLTVNEVTLSTGALTDITSTKGAWTYYSSNPGLNYLPQEGNMAAWSFSGGNTFGDGKNIAVVISPNVTDTAGNSIQGNMPDGSYAFSFTTGAATANFTGFDSATGGFAGGGTFGQGQFMPPHVIGTTPPPGAFDIPRNTKIVINFSDAMADDVSGTYVLKDYVKLYTVSNNVETEVSSTAIDTVVLDSTKRNATLNLKNTYNSGTFAASASYSLKVLGGAKSATNITLAPPNQSSTVMYQLSFKTSATSDNNAPSLTGSYPNTGDTAVPVNVGAISVGFDKDMNASTITNSTYYLSVGSTAVNGTVEYRPIERQAYFMPSAALNANTTYTINLTTGITGLNSQAIAAATRTFTTGSADTIDPTVGFINADDYSLAITYSEPMNAAKATDSINFTASVLKVGNYAIKYGATGFAAAAGTAVTIPSSASLTYDSVTNTVIIGGYHDSSLSAAALRGQEILVTVTGVKDLSGRSIATANSANTGRSSINNSATTGGALGPMAMSTDAFSGGGGFRPDNFSSDTFGFAPPIEVRPFNMMAGQSTIYGVRLPISRQIPAGGSIVLTFPTGFNVTSTRQDINSPMRTDLNGPGTGAPTFKCATATGGTSCGGGATVTGDETGSVSKGGLADDGVLVNTGSRTVTVYLSAATNSEGHDFLNIDLAGIVNSSVPKDFNTGGYTIDIKTKNAAGTTVLESLTSQPFFIQSAGTRTLSGTITATGATGGTMKVYLMSPLTGPLEDTSDAFNAGSAAYSFSNLPDGEYMLYTDQVNSLTTAGGAVDFTGKSIPERVQINGNTVYNFTIANATTGGTNITVNIDGPSATALDIFAGSPLGYKTKQVTLDSSAGAEAFTINLADGTWYVGVGPQMPKGPMSGPPPSPNYLPPQPKEVRVANPACTINGTVGCSTTFTLTASDKTIKGVVKDGSSKVIANAEVYAYSPSGGMGTHAQADSAGSFTLNVVDGTYVVGSFVPGMPPSKEVPVTVNSDTSKGGHATNYLFIDGSLTGISAATALTTFILRVAKPDYTISGKVTDGTNVVQGASVYAYRTDGPGHANANTDSSGNYTLYVSNGSWRVGAFLPQYGNLTELSVTINGSSSSNQNFAPSGTGTFYTISGRVYKNLNGDADYDSGEELQGVFVKLEGNSTFNETISGSDGTFSFKAPAGNNYRLRAFAPNIGELPATAAFNVAADVSNKDIVVTTPRTVTITFSSSVTEAFVEAFASTGVGNRTRVTNATTGTLSLPDGSYTVRVNIPGMIIGLTDIAATDANTAYSNTTGVMTVADGNEGLTVTLPTLKTVSGTVTDGTNNISEAWVEIANPTTGIHFGTKTDSDGAFSLQVAQLSTYMINAMKPGYFREPNNITVGSTNLTGQTLTLTTASRSIAGQILIGSSGASNAFVRAEKQGGGFAGTQADTNGNYTLYVSPGVWRIFAVAEGYSEAAYASNPIDVSSVSTSGKNITLSSQVSLAAPKSKPITPASGGTLEDSTAGIKLTIPANALGSDTSSGNIQAKATNNVRATGSARPLRSYDSTNNSYVNAGKEIKATDSSGSPITTLNDSVTVEMTYTLAELANTASDSDSSINTKSESDKLKMAYWDETTANWVTLSSAVTYKDADGDIITDSTAIDTAAEYAANVSTVTIAAATTHFSLYAPVVATDALAPSTPGGLSATAQTTTDIGLSWTAVSGATSYDIYRSTASDGTFSRLGSEPTVSSGSTTSYSDHNLAVATTYYYKITALNNSGESAASSAVNATTNSAAGTTTGGGGGGVTIDRTAPAISGISFVAGQTQATIKWTTSEASLSWLMYGTTASYGLEYKTTAYKTLHEVSLTGLAPNTIYHFTVKSQDLSANVTNSSDQIMQTTADEAATTTSAPATVTAPSTTAAPAATVTAPAATAKTPAKTKFTPLKLGSRGATVTKLQDFLVKQKYLVIPKGIAKGYFAGLTQAALMKFQKANGLTADGELNEATQAKIDLLSALSAPKASAAQLEGKVVKAPGSAAIYLIKNGVKKPFTSEMMFFSYGYKWTDVATYDLSEVSSGENMVYSDGHTFTSGQMLKGEDAKVYFVDQWGTRHWVKSEAAFLGLGYQWNQVAWISNTALNKYSEGSEIASAATRPNGSLVKYAYSDKVYLLENGLKRWIDSEAAFNAHQYGWYNIIVVPMTETYADGANLSS